MKDVWNKLVWETPKVEQPTLYGSSRFQTKKESRSILSRWNKGLVVDGCRRMSRKKAIHTLVLAPTGSGKSVWITANLLKPKGDSYIVTDTSGELYNLTANYLRSKGYHVMVCNLSQEGEPSLRYNPLLFLKTDQDIMRFTKVLLKAQGMDRGNDPFWQLATEQLFFVLVKTILQMEENKRTLLTLSEMLDLCASDIETAEGVLSPYMNDVLYVKFSGFKNYSDKLRSSILATATAVLNSLNDAYLQQLTSGNDIDLSLLRKHKTILFIQTKERDLAYTAFLRNLLLKDVFYQLLQPRKKKEKRVYAFLDEFANVYVPDFGTLITTCRKYDVSLICAVQDLQQLQENYPKSYETLISNFLLKMVFSGLNATSAEHISRLLGTTTAVQFHEQGQSTTFHARRLLTADEIRTLQPHQGLMIFANQLPILLTLKPWYNNLWLRLRAGVDI